MRKEVENSNGTLVRDMNSKAIINVDEDSLIKAKRIKKNQLEKQKEIENLRSELEQLKAVVQELTKRSGD